MNSVGTIASGVRIPSTSARRAEHPRVCHRDTSCTSPASCVLRAAGRVEEHVVERRLAREPQALSHLGLETRGRALAHDPAVVDDREPVAELVRLLQVLRRQEDRRASLVDATQLVPDGQAARGIEAGRRLVEKQHLGLVHERRREVEASLHPAGVTLDRAIGRVGELHELEQLDRTRTGLARRQIEQATLEDEQLATGLPRIEAGLLERDADPPPHLVRLALDVDARDTSAARREREQRRQHPHRRRLARAVRAEKTEHLAGLDPQIDTLHGVDRARPAAVRLDQPFGLHCGSGSSIPHA